MVKNFERDENKELTATALARALGLSNRSAKKAVERNSRRIIKDTDKIFQFTKKNGATVQGFKSAKEIAKELDSDLAEVKEYLIKGGLRTTFGTYASILRTPFQFKQENTR